MREIAQCFKKYGFESDKDLTYKCASDFTIEDVEKALDIIKLALVNDECFINIIKNPLNDKENVFFLYSKRIEQLLFHFIDLENKNPCIVYNYLTWDNLCEEWKEILFDNICEEWKEILFDNICEEMGRTFI